MTLHHSRRAAFTLLELIVTIGIVAVLLGLTLPVIRQVRFEAGKTATLANQGSAFQTLTQYMHDHKDAYPYYGEPGTQEALLEWDGRLIDNRHWSQPKFWGLYLHTLGYDGWTSLGPGAHPQSYEEIRDGVCEGCGPDFISMHVLTNVVFAKTQFWSIEEAPSKRHHIGMRGVQVAHPSAKSILIMRLPADPRNPKARTLTHFADGHGAVVRFIDMAPGVPRGRMDFDGWPMYSTARGVLGHDL